MRILVTAASKHGATAELSEWIAAGFRGAGAEATVEAPDAVASLIGYDAVVLGSGVYAGHWLEPAKTFALRFTGELTTGRTWIFSSGPIGDPLKPDETPVDVNEMLPLTGAREHRLFGGRIDKSTLGFGERAILAALRVPEGDFRPRDEVVAWAQEIAGIVGAELGQTPIAASS
jgi:menaquinone-dependent protoporphyrinogen oxidase